MYSYFELVVVLTALEMCFGTDAVLGKLTAERTKKRLEWHQEFITWCTWRNCIHTHTNINCYTAYIVIQEALLLDTNDVLCQSKSCQLLLNCTKVPLEKACNKWITSRVIEVHWHWSHSIGYIRFPISLYQYYTIQQNFQAALPTSD